jgi:hypothetical protein
MVRLNLPRGDQSSQQADGLQCKAAGSAKQLTGVHGNSPNYYLRSTL